MTFIDSSRVKTLEDAIQRFEKGNTPTLPPRVGGGYPIWYTFRLHNASEDTKWDLYFKDRLLSTPNYIYVYYQNESMHSGVDFAQNGFYLPFSQRQNAEDYKRITLDLVPGETYRVYVKAVNIHQSPLPTSINLEQHKTWSDTFLKQQARKGLEEGILQGMIWIFIMYNVVLSIMSREKIHLYYGLYLFFAGLYFLYRSGYLQYFPPFRYQPELINYMWTTSLLAPAFFILFIRKFLFVKKNFPTLDIALKYIAWLAIGIYILESIIYTITENTSLLNQINTYSFVAAVVGIMLCFLLPIKMRNPLVYYFMFGSLTLSFAAITGVFTENYYLTKIGLMIQVVTFTVGMGHRIRENEKQKNKAQASYISQLKENEKMQRDAKRELEARVQERTAKIEKQKEELLAQTDKLKEANAKVQYQSQLLTEKNLKIVDSINYAQRMQEALLPDLSKIALTLPNTFVFFKPKDIVSGDFYWYHAKDGKSFLAAVDCTGHGVPGAFMSLIGYNLLDRFVKHENYSMPGEILDQMQIGVQQVLNHTTTNRRDGMDMGICMIDHRENKLYFAGAKNPLYYIQNNQLGVLKGEKQSIGENTRKGHSFPTHILDLNESTTIYMASDGYQDQFGGPEKRKFLRKHLKQVLHSIHHLPIEDQSLLLEDRLSKWMEMGREAQIDDVLVIGCKVS
ncbi:hypothetical protein GCM10023331_39990 [Algivirga pacifica]|uniref:PPM-type phosphatase domain-containing protein n=1 Tax=Algivirga pacifica TaxID=1162670 RepID=A0ABP9DL68_9BACT